MIFPNIWTNLNFIQKLNKASNKSLGQGYQKNNYTGDILMGLSLGPVFTTCSPTYLFIIATILPSSFLKGSFYLVGFVMGLAISLLLVAYFGQKVINIFIEKENLSKNLKKVFMTFCAGAWKYPKFYTKACRKVCILPRLLPLYPARLWNLLICRSANFYWKKPWIRQRAIMIISSLIPRLLWGF